jgi:hypothetical protein
MMTAFFFFPRGKRVRGKRTRGTRYVIATRVLLLTLPLPRVSISITQQAKQSKHNINKRINPWLKVSVPSVSHLTSLFLLSLSLSISLSLSRKASPAAHILLFFSFVPRRLFLRRLLLELLVLHGPGDGADHVRLEVLVQLCQYRRPGVAAPYADPLKAKFETSLYLSHFIGSKGWFEKTYRCAFASAMGQVKR